MRIAGKVGGSGVTGFLFLASHGWHMEPVQWLAALVIAMAVVAVVRGVDVRIALFAAACVLAALANNLPLVLRSFFETFSNEKFVVPICSAMGFAYVLRRTECDRHLVQLLVKPLQHVRYLLVPGVVVIGFIVNVPVISQTSVAVCIGPVVVPLMRAAGFRAMTIAACLCLGASIGGELLNPGAPELLTVSAKTGVDSRTLSMTHLPPLLFPYAIITLLAFWLQTMWEERRHPTVVPVEVEAATALPSISLVKAAVPMVPLLLLFLTGPPLSLFPVPMHWLADNRESFGSRLIGAAMLFGVLVAAVVSPRKAKDCAKQFFEGAGYGFATIVSLIVTATCFADAMKACGLAKSLGTLIGHAPEMLTPLAAIVPGAFAFISGSGMASTKGLYEFFYDPAIAHGYDAPGVGGIVSIASAAGRTMSPVAAVVLMCGTLTGVKPFDIVKRVAGPLLIGLTATVILRMCGVV